MHHCPQEEEEGGWKEEWPNERLLESVYVHVRRPRRHCRCSDDHRHSNEVALLAELKEPTCKGRVVASKYMRLTAS